MGGLSLAVEDESNLIGLNKFGGNPAGMVLDYEKSKIEFDYRNLSNAEISFLAPPRKTYLELEGSHKSRYLESTAVRTMLSAPAGLF